MQLGDLLRRDEHFAEAEGAYSRAIERIAEPEPEHWTLFYARGITYERTKRWPQAEKPTSCTPWSSSPSSRSCSTISATAGSTWA